MSLGGGLVQLGHNFRPLDSILVYWVAILATSLNFKLPQDSLTPSRPKNAVLKSKFPARGLYIWVKFWRLAIIYLWLGF